MRLRIVSPDMSRARSAARSRSSASARRPTTSTGRRRTPSSSSRSRRSSAACEDAGIDPREIDGFASYSNDRNDPSRLAAALGLPELRFSNMQWGGGGGGGSGGGRQRRGGDRRRATPTASSCSARSPRGSSQRFGAGAARGDRCPARPRCTLPYGLMSPGPALRHARRCASCTSTASSQEALRAIALASYHHAQTNPRAVMHGRPADARGLRRLALDRRAVPPVRLLPGERRRRRAGPRARRARPRPARSRPRYILGVAQGSRVPERRAAATTRPLYATSSFTTVAPHLYEHGRRRARRTSTCCRATRTSPAAC